MHYSVFNRPFKKAQRQTQLTHSFTVFTFDFKGVGLDVLAGRGHGDHVERKFTL